MHRQPTKRPKKPANVTTTRRHRQRQRTSKNFRIRICCRGSQRHLEDTIELIQILRNKWELYYKQPQSWEFQVWGEEVQPVHCSGVHVAQREPIKGENILNFTQPNVKSNRPIRYSAYFALCVLENCLVALFSITFINLYYLFINAHALNFPCKGPKSVFVPGSGVSLSKPW